MAGADFRVFCGTNVLCPAIEKYALWKVPDDLTFYKDTILMAVGWNNVQTNVSPQSKAFYSAVISHSMLHSTRDAFTAENLIGMGFLNTLNTGCVTLWDLTDEFLATIPKKKGTDVVTTLTAHRKNPVRDAAQLDILCRNYRNVFFWPQGLYDEDYFHSLPHDPKIHVLDRSLAAYDELLMHGGIDYVGTRLHGGIHALHAGRRTLVIEVDNRARELAHDTGFPTIAAELLPANLEKAINSSFATTIRLPRDEIALWKQQFKGEAIARGKLTVSEARALQTRTKSAKKGVKTIAFAFQGFSQGGLQRVMSLLLPKFARHGYRVVALTTKDAADDVYSIDEPIERIVLGADESSAIRCARLRNAILEYGIDCVIFQEYYSPRLVTDVAVVKGMGIPYLIHHHSMFSNFFVRGNVNIDDAQYLRIFTEANAMIVLSRADEYYFRTLGANAHYFPNPISDVPNGFVRVAGTKKILWMARFVDGKCPLDALAIHKKVLRRHSDAELFMLGGLDGNIAKKVKESVSGDEELKRTVHLEGFQDDVWLYLSESAALLTTSKFEGSPCALAEAAAAGVPTVGYELPYLSIAEGNDGFIQTPQGDVDSAAEAICRLFEDPDFAVHASASARATFERMRDFDQMAAYDKLLGEVFHGVRSCRDSETFESMVLRIAIRDAIAGAAELKRSLRQQSAVKSELAARLDKQERLIEVIREERENAKEDRSRWKRDRDRVLVEKEKLVAQLGKQEQLIELVRGERENAKEDRNRWKRDRDRALAEKEKLVAQLSKQEQLIEVVRGERENAKEDRNRWKKDRDRVLAEKEKLVAQLGKQERLIEVIRGERKKANEERARWKKDRDRVLAENEKLTASKKTCMKENKDLQNECRRLAAELDRNRKTLEKLSSIVGM